LLSRHTGAGKAMASTKFGWRRRTDHRVAPA
jgi:hypothetical protein